MCILHVCKIFLDFFLSHLFGCDEHRGQAFALWQPEKDLAGHLQCDVKGTMRESWLTLEEGRGCRVSQVVDGSPGEQPLPLPHVPQTQRTGVGCISPLYKAKPKKTQAGFSVHYPVSIRNDVFHPPYHRDPEKGREAGYLSRRKRIIIMTNISTSS